MTDEPRTPEPDDTAQTEPLSTGDPLGDSPKSDAPPPSSPGVRRLTRSSSDKLIGGVAGGLGRYFGVDPILFRIAFVVLTFAGGVGVLAYIGLLAFVPADDDSRAFGQRRDANLIGAVLLGIVVLLILGPPFFFVGPALIPIALLIGIGVLLWRAAGGKPPSGDPGRLVARAVIALLIGIAAVGGFAGVFVLAALGGGTTLAILAIVAGVALVVAGLAGGARWLIVPALVLVLPLAIVAAADVRVDGGVGERSTARRPWRRCTRATSSGHRRAGRRPARRRPARGHDPDGDRHGHRPCRRARARGCMRVIGRADRRGPRAGARPRQRRARRGLRRRPPRRPATGRGWCSTASWASARSRSCAATTRCPPTATAGGTTT